MERLEIIETLKHMPDALEAVLEGVPEDVLRARPPEGWSAKEVVGHINDYCEVWHTRLYTVWALNDPVFVSFDGEQRVIERGYQDKPVAPVIESIRAKRLETVDLLSHAVDWTRLGQQGGVGRRSLKQFAELLIEHDRTHLAQIEACKASAAVRST